jgi:hypothetical protein
VLSSSSVPVTAAGIEPSILGLCMKCTTTVLQGHNQPHTQLIINMFQQGDIQYVSPVTSVRIQTLNLRIIIQVYYHCATRAQPSSPTIDSQPVSTMCYLVHLSQ